MAGQVATSEKYEELIQALTTFCTSVTDAAQTLSTAASVCADNMGSDDISKKASAKIGKIVPKYQAVVEQAQNIIVALNKDLEKIQEIETAMGGE